MKHLAVRTTKPLSICMRWGAAVLILAAACTSLISTTAAAKGSRASEPLQAPYGFELKASNGYSITAFVLGKLNGPGELFLSVTADRRGVTYIAPAKYTSKGFSADLGEIGRIAVRFHPSG